MIAAAVVCCAVRPAIRSVVLCAALFAAFPATAQLTIGGTFTATGSNASIGIPGKTSMEVLPTTIGGLTVRMVLLDDGGDPSVAARNARKLATEEKVDVIFGSSSTPTSLAIADVAAETKTPQLALAPIPIRNPYVFSVPQSVMVMVEGVVLHMKANGVKSVGFVGFSDGWGDQNFEALQKHATAAGIKIVANERYARTDTSVTAQILRIVAAGADAVFVGGASTPAALPSIALVERGFKGRVYHTHGVINPDFLRVGGKAVEGIVAPSGPFVVAAQLPDSNPIKAIALDYAKRYEDKFGAGTKNPFGAYVWDAYQWLNAAIPVALKKGKPGTPEFRSALRDAIEGLKDVPGSHAVYTLSPENHNGVDGRGRVMVRVENGAFKVLP
ncbi:MAG: ABC transporter substrate-binding protein [Burkholderiales bacterium]